MSGKLTGFSRPEKKLNKNGTEMKLYKWEGDRWDSFLLPYSSVYE